jgi:hypothetical protein
MMAMEFSKERGAKHGSHSRVILAGVCKLGGTKPNQTVACGGYKRRRRRSAFGISIFAGKNKAEKTVTSYDEFHPPQ